MITTECKSLYHVLEAGRGVPAYKRIGLEAFVLRQDQALCQHVIRWVPTEMLSDPMTKVFTKESRLDAVISKGRLVRDARSTRTLTKVTE